MNIGDEVFILQSSVGKRGKIKKVKVGTGVIIDFNGAVGFNDDELVCAVRTDTGQVKEFTEDNLLLKSSCNQN